MEHDATELIKKWSGGPLDILIDVVSFFPSFSAFLFPPSSIHFVSRITSNPYPGHRRQLLQTRPTPTGELRSRSP